MVLVLVNFIFDFFYSFAIIFGFCDLYFVCVFSLHCDVFVQLLSLSILKCCMYKSDMCW